MDRRQRNCVIKIYKNNQKRNNKRIVISSAITGFLCGMFSSGGGIIAVLAFKHILKYDDKKSRAMAICSILPMCIASSAIYLKGNYIDIKKVIFCSIGGGIGGCIGSIFLEKINSKYLQIIFIGFMIYAGVKMLVC